MLSFLICEGFLMWAKIFRKYNIFLLILEIEKEKDEIEH